MGLGWQSIQRHGIRFGLFQGVISQLSPVHLDLFLQYIWLMSHEQVLM